jgi:hypothetical protein
VPLDLGGRLADEAVSRDLQGFGDGSNVLAAL